MPDASPSEETSADLIRWERQGQIFVITVDRPAKYNGFTPEMLRSLAQAMTEYERDDEARCAVLQANGDHFTAGLQLTEFDMTQSDMVPEGMVDPVGLRPPWRTKPVVAAWAQKVPTPTSASPSSTAGRFGRTSRASPRPATAMER